MTLNENLIPLKEDSKIKVGYNPIGDERKVFDQFLSRKKELLNSRKNVHGQNLDEMMRRYDRNYFNREADIPAVELDPDQKPISINNVFGKVQAALSILIDRNPKIILEESLKKYSANRELIRALAESSWKKTNSLGQFKLSIFNAAKRGWLAGRTLNRVLQHEARFAKSMDDQGRIAYEKRMITKLDDVAYMNLDNHNVWFDEQARPEDMFSMRDAMHREIWHIDDVKRVFPIEQFPNMEFVIEGGDVQETVEGDIQKGENQASQARELKKGMTELFFYENQFEDRFIIEIHGAMVVWEPLPQNHKRLSYITAHWNLRSAETIYGIGIVEEMERDETLIDRILNMTMRQLLLSINPPGFYTGPEDLENENIKIEPGVFRKTLDPKNIQWLQVPPADLQKTLQVAIPWLESKEEQKTGITKRLEGEEQIKSNDTAFEIGVSREASLKRLRLPLKSFQYALSWEFQNRVDLIKQTYSDFQVEHLANEEDIMNYLEEVGADPDFYSIEHEGVAGQEKFFVKKFREINLFVDQDDKGQFVESDKKKFFKIKPEHLSWEGDVTVDVNSMLVQSEELERADTLRMTNLLVPLFMQPIELALKPAKQLLLSFNKDPQKWFPQVWLDALEGKKEKPPVEVPSDIQAMLERSKGMSPKGEGQIMETETVVPQRQLEKKPSLGDRFKSAFQTFRGK